MTTSIASALTLMVIGMITVFAVLFLVYLVGNLLVRFVNRWSLRTPSTPSPSSDIDRAKIAAITVAVEAVTRGKASITNIQKQ